MRKEVEIKSVFSETIDKLKGHGVILLAGDPPNPMTIGWGTIGYIWGKWIFTVMVRPTRFTHHLMESSHEFSVNVFSGEFNSHLSLCGTKSGRDTDKIKECSFTLETGIQLNAPFIGESILHYECRILQKNDILQETLDQKIIDRYYPLKDFHRVYYGEIVGVFMEGDEGMK